MVERAERRRPGGDLRLTDRTCLAQERHVGAVDLAGVELARLDEHRGDERRREEARNEDEPILRPELVFDCAEIEPVDGLPDGVLVGRCRPHAERVGSASSAMSTRCLPTQSNETSSRKIHFPPGTKWIARTGRWSSARRA